MTAPPIVVPDLELWATGYLRTALAARDEPYAADVHVDIRAPRPRTDRMVTVRRDGGARLDLVRDAARLAVRVWATTEQDATDLARLVRALLHAGADGTTVVAVRDLSGPSAVPDPSEQPQRYLLVEVILRGADLTP
jgi:hypothetical protein